MHSSILSQGNDFFFQVNHRIIACSIGDGYFASDPLSENDGYFVSDPPSPSLQLEIWFPLSSYAQRELGKHMSSRFVMIFVYMLYRVQFKIFLCNVNFSWIFLCCLFVLVCLLFPWFSSMV